MSEAIVGDTSISPTNTKKGNIHFRYLRTLSGILMILELILSIVCSTISAKHILSDDFVVGYMYKELTFELFFCIVTSAFMIGNFLLLLGCLVCFSTSCTRFKALSGNIYHSVAFGVFLTSSVQLLVMLKYVEETANTKYLFVATICGAVNSILHFISGLRAHRICVIQTE